MHCLGWMRILPRSIWALSYTWLRRLGEEIRRFDAKEEEKKKKKKKKKRKSKRSEEERGSDEEDKENVEVTDDDEDSDDDDNDNDDEKEAGEAPARRNYQNGSSRSCMACGTKLPSVSSNGARAKCLRCFARRTWILGMRPGTKMGGF